MYNLFTHKNKQRFTLIATQLAIGLTASHFAFSNIAVEPIDEEKKIPINGPLFGFNNTIKAATAEQSPVSEGELGRVVIDRLRPTNYRYPVGNGATYWDASFWKNSKDRMAAYSTTIKPEQFEDQKDYFNTYVLNYDKLPSPMRDNKKARPIKPLEDVVKMANANNMTVTFICNMVTPGADYFNQTDAPSPRKKEDLKLSEITSEYESASFESDPWWSHMKQRATACVTMLNEAVAFGLAEDRIRVELGNELFYYFHPYVLEVFPPALPVNFSKETLKNLRKRKMFSSSSLILNSADKEANSIVKELEAADETDCDTVDSASIEIKRLVCAIKANDYESRDVMNYAGWVTPSDAYAQAALYFAKRIRVAKDANEHTPFANIEIAAVGADSKIKSLFPHNAEMRLAEWNFVLQSTIDELDPSDTLINALANHDYPKSPDFCSFDFSGVGKYRDAWTGQHLGKLLDGEASKEEITAVDPMGTITRQIVRNELEKQGGSLNCGIKYVKENDVWKEQNSCVDFSGYKIWRSEFAFDYAHIRPVAERLRPATLEDMACNIENDSDSPRCWEVYDSSWARALGNGYLINYLLSFTSTDSLDFFDAQTIVDPQSFDLVDANGKVIQLWQQAASGADSRIPLSFSGVAAKVKDSEDFFKVSKDANAALLAEFKEHCSTEKHLVSYNEFPAQTLEETGPFDAVSGWYFSKGQSGQAVLINMGDQAQTIDISSLGFGSKTLVQKLSPIKKINKDGMFVPKLSDTAYGQAINVVDQLTIVIPARSIMRLAPAVEGDLDSDGQADVLVVESGVENAWEVHPMLAGSAMSPLRGYDSDFSGFAALHSLSHFDDLVVKAMLDYDGDGDEDLVSFNESTHTYYFHEVENGIAVASDMIASSFSGNEQVVLQGAGNFVSMTSEQLLFKDHASQNYIILSLADFPAVSETTIAIDYQENWHVEAVSDFDADGKDDILFRKVVENETSTQWVVLYSEAGLFDLSQSINIESSIDWQLVAAKDFDGDGKADILLANQAVTTSWKLLTTEFNGSFDFSETVSGLPTSNNYAFAVAGDFDGDGDADLIFKDTAQSTWVNLEMDQGQVVSTRELTNMSSADRFDAVSFVAPAKVYVEEAGDFGFEVKEDGQVVFYHQDYGWSAGFNYLCIGVNACLSGTRTNGRFERPINVGYGDLQIEFKVQDNEATETGGQCLTGLLPIRFEGASVAIESSCK